ncbi:MAG: translation initiation factor [Muribaculaceae bacterium]|nr:translation initiation factor [Muribaculaceae bacterium]
MNEDWKLKLSSLKEALPDDPSENLESSETPEAVADKTNQVAPLSVIIDKKGRNGKIATIIEGFTIPQAEVEKIAKQLKQKFGVGGSTRNGEILLQGDHRTETLTFLRNLNFKVK